jgi:very-short-patch-repair endonuclease
MIESIVFFTLLAAGIIAYIVFLMYPDPDPSLVPTTPIKSEYSKCQSPIERTLYNALTISGYQVFTQHKVGPYRGDLFIPPKLIIECDGKAYHKDKEKDKRRDKFIEQQGYKVIRFPGSRIHRDLKGVLRRIDKEFKKV